jgi:protein-S-isoprenylcysteine O-methyltransferase Ste14
MERVLLPVALALFALFAFLLPALRLRRRIGISGITFHRTRSAGQRLVGALLAAGLLGLTAFTVAYAALGPAAVGAPGPESSRTLAGFALVAAGLALVMVAQAQMRASWRIGIDDRPTELVTWGLYRRVRNPIYSGLFLALAGIVLVAPAPALVALAAATVVVVAVQTRLEERHLTALHAAGYLAWAARTGRFVPGVGRLVRRAGV